MLSLKTFSFSSFSIAHPFPLPGVTPEYGLPSHALQQRTKLLRVKDPAEGGIPQHPLNVIFAADVLARNHHFHFFPFEPPVVRVRQRGRLNLSLGSGLRDRG